MELLKIAKDYKNVISAFKKRYDVQNGYALGYHVGHDMSQPLLDENRPKTMGEGLGTTGYCVSASNALLNDNVFGLLLGKRGAKAKLVSIDIREQYWGYCYSGTQNKWHTAILVNDSGINFIVDITCRQFGNNFIDKDIWDFPTWERTFRSPLDKHILTDFAGNTLSNIKAAANNIMFDDISEVVYRLQDNTTLVDSERQALADFFVRRLPVLNKKLTIGNIASNDLTYLDTILKLLTKVNFGIKEQQYAVLEFSTKELAKEWIMQLTRNEFVLPQFIISSDTLEKACKYSNINVDDVNSESQKEITYIVFDFVSIKGIDVSFINENVSICLPHGIKLEITDIPNQVYNGGKLLSVNVDGIPKKTNTIYIKTNN